jgi:transposase
MDMQVVEEYYRESCSRFPQLAALPDVSQKRETPEPKLPEMQIDELRRAIRKNQVSFPAQVPAFPKHDRPDLQQKLVQLYFVLGWSCPRIAKRYGLSRLRVQQILKAWKKRAVEVGYIQTVPPPEGLQAPSADSPIKAVFSMVNTLSAVARTSAESPTQSGELADEQAPSRNALPSGCRPRRRFDVTRVMSVLNELEAGRSVAEMANELGVSAGTIHAWQRQNERNSLRRENRLLKDQLAKLGETQAKLIGLITRNDKAEDHAFMPFLRI